MLNLAFRHFSHAEFSGRRVVGQHILCAKLFLATALTNGQHSATKDTALVQSVAQALCSAQRKGADMRRLGPAEGMGPRTGTESCRDVSAPPLINVWPTARCAQTVSARMP